MFHWLWQFVCYFLLFHHPSAGHSVYMKPICVCVWVCMWMCLCVACSCHLTVNSNYHLIYRCHRYGCRFPSSTARHFGPVLSRWIYWGNGNPCRTPLSLRSYLAKRKRTRRHADALPTSKLANLNLISRPGDWGGGQIENIATFWHVDRASRPQPRKVCKRPKR